MSSTPPPLNALIVADAADAEFITGVLEDHGDAARAVGEVPDALSTLSQERFDMALVSLSLPRGDGLALVHHLRALHPGVDLVVIAGAEEMEQMAHAMALGVVGHVVRPLTGDALLVTADRVRERRMLVYERERLASERAASRQRTATYARCAAFVSETDASAIAPRVLDACMAEVPATAAAIYMPSMPGDARLARVAMSGETDRFSAQLDATEVDALDPTQVVHRIDDEVPRVRLLLLGDAQVEAVVDLVLEQDTIPQPAEEALEVIAALGTSAFAGARNVDAIARTGIKDPETSAYTFSYFGDVAGREIDRAARHGRRFAMLAVSIDGLETLRQRLSYDAMMRARRAVADALLEGVRDSDVVARVEEDEFYLLLPETGLLGALTCRRRIGQRLAEAGELRELAPPDVRLEPVVGLSVYPTDGADLGRLLRSGRRRAERSRRGVWRRLGLGNKTFWEAIDTLLGDAHDATVGEDGTISMHANLMRAHDDVSLSRHAAFPLPVVRRIGRMLAEDASRRGLSGTLYVAGDPELADAVANVGDHGSGRSLRTWALTHGAGKRDANGSAGAQIRLGVDDPRLDERVLLLSLTELGGYVLAARPVADGTLLAYHASDLDITDGLVASLQEAYNLQPEVAS